MTPAKIMKLDPDGALAIEAKARLGESEAARDFILYAAWKKIKGDDYIPDGKKVKVFTELAKIMGVVEVENGG